VTRRQAKEMFSCRLSLAVSYAEAGAIQQYAAARRIAVYTY
jgi:hypothetical protein